MGIQKKQEIPRGLEGIQRQIEQWRQACKVREPIPNRFWDAAARMVKVYGMNQTARALRLNYDRLKKRVERHAVAAVKGKKAKGSVKAKKAVSTSTARFVELAPVASVGGGECCVELEDGRGAVMRVRLQGMGMPDLATLTRAFLNGDRRP